MISETMTNNAYTWTDNFSELVEKYAEQIMDSMDMKTMEQFVFDTLVENLNNYSESELINEIRECYGDEMLEDFGVKITEVPDMEA
jgi:aminoglycoside phosphotransferase family enzyme